MNGFEKHGLTHSSISQLNKWIGCPSAWVSHYLYGNRGGSSPAMWRGIFCEQLVADCLMGQSFEKSLKKALADYDKKTPLADEKSEKERNNIQPMAELAIAELEQYGKPDFPLDGQHKVSMTAKGDGWSIDFIGFLDFKWPDHGLIVDLKTTLRMMSTMPIGHQRQRAFYAKANGNMAVKFLYVTPKKAEMKEDGNVNELMADIKAHLTRQEAFLRTGDREVIRSIVPVDPDSFYWGGDEQKRMELFGV